MTPPLLLALILAIMAIVLNSHDMWKYRNEKWKYMNPINART